MKHNKRLAAALTAALILASVSFTSCNKNSAGNIDSTPNSQITSIDENASDIEKAAALYEASNKQLDGAQTLRMTREMSLALGMYNTVTTTTMRTDVTSQFEDGHIKAMDKEQTVDMGTSKSEFRIVYLNGISYNKSDDQRFKSVMSPEDFEKDHSEADVNYEEAFDITGFGKVTVTQNDDETTTVEFSQPNEGLIETMKTKLDTLIAPRLTEAKLTNISGSTVFDKNGLKKDENISFSYEGTSQNINATLEVGFDVSILSINQAVDITEPLDAKFYNQLDDPIILDTITAAMTSYLSKMENDITIKEDVDISGAMEFKRVLDTSIAYQTDDEGILTFVQNIDQKHSGKNAVDGKNYNGSWVYDGKTLVYHEADGVTDNEAEQTDAWQYLNDYIARPYVASSGISNLKIEDMADGARKIKIELIEEDAINALAANFYSFGINITDAENIEFRGGDNMYIILDKDNEVSECRYDMEITATSNGEQLKGRYVLEFKINPKGTTVQKTAQNV